MILTFCGHTTTGNTKDYGDEDVNDDKLIGEEDEEEEENLRRRMKMRRRKRTRQLGEGE